MHIGKVAPLLAKFQGNTVQQHRQFGACQGEPRRVDRAQFLVCAPLEPFIEQPEAIAVPNQDLDAIAPAIEENEDRPIERVASEMLPDQRNEAIVLLAEVDGCRAREDLQLTG